jgi:hypothetical protein
MKPKRLSLPLVPALAVAALTLSALAAAWFTPREPQDLRSERPDLTAQVQVVKAPPVENRF